MQYLYNLYLFIKKIIYSCGTSQFINVPINEYTCIFSKILLYILNYNIYFLLI